MTNFLPSKQHALARVFTNKQFYKQSVLQTNKQVTCQPRMRVR